VRVFHKLEEISQSLSSSSAIAIGNFDGVHLGHQSLLKRLVQSAKERNLPPVVLTFYPHPVEVLNPSKKLERLTTTIEKLSILETMGIDSVYVMQFDQALSQLTPEEFFSKVVKEGLKAQDIHVGFNFMFGKKRAGNISVLHSLCEKNGIALQVEEAYEYKGVRVSSSLIREAIIQGDVTRAHELLGRPYFLIGTVKHGDKRGGQIGFPTANIHCSAEKVLPKAGVYVTQVLWQKQVYKSVTNVGVRPTFQSESQTLVVETHIMGFNSRIYDETLELRFIRRLRDEKKFDSVDSLKIQIQKDIDTAILG
jgi:riboflavin kinase/FMN adenylyltransferase